MRSVLFTIIFFIYALTGVCQEKYKNSVAINGRLTEDTWFLDMSYVRMLNKFVGCGAGCGIWKQYLYEEMFHGRGWELNDESKACSTIYLRPFVQLLSPAVIKTSGCKFRLCFEPGLMLRIPWDYVNIDIIDGNRVYSNKYVFRCSKGQWLSFDCKSGLDVNFENFNVCVGYMCSTLDVYTYRRRFVFRNKSYNDCLPARKLMQGAFATISYNW